MEKLKEKENPANFYIANKKWTGGGGQPENGGGGTFHP